MARGGRSSGKDLPSATSSNSRRQCRRTPPSAKPWKGLGAGVYELIEDHRGDTYRAVYTVRITDRVHVLHAFQKKSKSGVKTPKADVA